VSLEYAPLVTSLLAFLIQTVPLAIVLWGDSEVYDDDLRRLLAVLVILFTLSTSEIWLNTTNSHFYLLLTTVLILFERLEGASIFRIWFYRLFLLIGGFTGPTSCVLTPLFFIKALFYRNREYLIQAILLTIASGVQLLVFLGNTSPITEERFSQLDLATFGHIVWARTIILPIAGLEAANKFAAASLAMLGANPELFKYLGILLFAGLVVILFAIGCFFRWPIRYDLSMLVVGTYVLVVTFSIVASITHGSKIMLVNAGWSPRYFYVPSVILLLLILSFIRPGEKGWFSIARMFICCILLIASIGNGIKSYQGDLNWNENWPIWRQEVSKYRADSTYDELQIWPPGWSIRLDQPIDAGN